MTEDHPKLTIVILNWNTADLLTSCLRSIRSRLSIPARVVVVDNASDDDSASRVRGEHPEVRLVVAPENLGFSRGNNRGLGEARGDYVLLLNPDTEVRTGSIEPLVEFLDEHPRAGIAGPTLVFPDGRHQSSTAPFPSLRTEFLRQTMLWRVLSTRDPDATRRVDSVTGAALCIRRSCLEEIGPLDESLFMFYEDVDWCRRATDAGWEVWYVETPGVMHVKAAASALHARTRTLLDSQRSTIRYFRKHHGRRSVRALRAIAGAAAIARFLRAALLGALGRDRSDQRQRIHAYRRILGWALRGGEL